MALRSQVRRGSARASTTRLVLALGVSLGVHIAVAPQMSLERAQFLGSPPLLSVTLEATPARVETQTEPTVERFHSESQLDPADVFPVKQHRTAAGRPHRRRSEAPKSVASEQPDRVRSEQPDIPSVQPLLPQRHATDRYYSARELDVYPRLRRPLGEIFEGPSVVENAGARLLVMVMLDESGKLDDVSIVEGARGDALASHVREALHRAGFFPAEKDGRFVRSRVLMSIDGSMAERTPAAAR